MHHAEVVLKLARPAEPPAAALAALPRFNDLPQIAGQVVQDLRRQDPVAIVERLLRPGHSDERVMNDGAQAHEALSTPRRPRRARPRARGGSGSGSSGGSSPPDELNDVTARLRGRD